MRFIPKLVAGVFLALQPVTSAQAQDGLQWFYAPPVQEAGAASTGALYFGIPETDAVQLWATCTPSAPNAGAQVTLGAPVQGLATGQNVQAVFTGTEFSWTSQARVIRLEEFIHGIEFTVPLDAPFWDGLIALDALNYQVAGQQTARLPLRGSARAARQFLAQCETAAHVSPVPSEPTPRVSKK